MPLTKFRTYSGEHIENVGEYVLEFLRKYPHSKVVVGCDSQHSGGNIQYAIIIALFYPERRGAHLVYKKFSRRMQKTNLSLYERIWAEIESTRELAQALEEYIWDSDYLYEIGYDGLQNFVQVHIDVNDNPRYKSNVLLNSAVGYLTGLGFNVSCKPTSWVASCAADIHVK